MESVRINVFLPPELLARVDGIRGDVPRSGFVRRLVERAVAEAAVVAPGSVSLRSFEAPRARGGVR